MIRRAKLLRPLLLLCAALSVGGCATPFDVGTADRNVTPRESVDNPALVRNRLVAWGGVLVNGKNLADNTQFEVVGYPLDRDNRPKPNTDPLGRFLVIHPGYLETNDYAPGRQITVVGKVTETRTGKVGAAQMVYPVVVADRLYLWPKVSEEQPREPRFHFGIGIGVMR
jgi:outer membrane lipoprotein